MYASFWRTPLFIGDSKFPFLVMMPGVAIVWGSILVGSVSAQEPITVKLLSGRKFTASVDARSNPQKLWLRFGSEGMSLLRPVAWEQIEIATYNGQKMHGLDLRTKVLNLASNHPTFDKTTVHFATQQRSYQTASQDTENALRGEHE